MIYLFMLMLNEMECLEVKLYLSSSVSIFADGDGDFQPKFKSDGNWEKVEPS